ncbi:DMT family transporter [Oricola sp.]|uniref:DMT family transporter n=1 Tax=Oricola sp. TaxID=1979950 RepID=UPI00320BE716|nr:DMT family transporter [Oricola sp.]
MNKTDEIGALPAADDHVRGMALCAGAMLLLPLMDAIAKWLSTEVGVSPGQLTLARFVVQAVVSGAIVVAIAGFAALWPKRPLMNLIRGAILGTASLLFFLALKYMPLADAISVFFVEPLILTILSVIFLHEKVGWRRVLAILVGFAGALIVIQPSYALFGAVSLLPLGTATLFASYLTLKRAAGVRDSAVVMQFAAGVGGVLVLSLATAAGTAWGIGNLGLRVDFPAYAWILMAVMGGVGMTGHYIIVLAFRIAPASLLAPFQYLEIVSAAAAGFLLFGDFPSLSKWIGVAMIVGSGLYVFWRERRRQ